MIHRHGYYEHEGVWSLELGSDKLAMAEIMAAFRPRRALELGCATGPVLHYPRALGVDAEGVEVSRMAVERAFPDVRDRIHHGDLLALGLDGEFDLVFGLDVFEHLNPNRLPDYLARLAGLLRSGGYLYAALPAFGDDPVFGLAFPLYLREWYQDVFLGQNFRLLHADGRGYPLNGHLVWADSRWWVRQFERAGFVRAEAIERAVHERYDRFFDGYAPARKAFYVFARAGAADGAREETVIDQLLSARSEALGEVAGSRPPGAHLLASDRVFAAGWHRLEADPLGPFRWSERRAHLSLDGLAGRRLSVLVFAAYPVVRRRPVGVRVTDLGSGTEVARLSLRSPSPSGSSCRSRIRAAASSWRSTRRGFPGSSPRTAPTPASWASASATPACSSRASAVPARSPGAPAGEGGSARAGRCRMAGMRVALLGAGRIGQLHARLLCGTDRVSELLVADVDPGRAAAVAASVGARAMESVEAALDRAEALVITAATDVHAALIRAGADRRIPVFCEKPIALELDETRRVVEHAERAGIPLQIGFQRRFDPAYREARRLVETGALGTLYNLRLAGHDPAPPHEAYIPASGGLFRDFSIHDFDVIRWLTGAEVEEVYADGGVRGFPVFAKYGDVDTAVATLRLGGGVLAVLTVARHDPLGYDIRTELFGSKDSIAVGLGPRTPIRSVEPGVPPPAGPAWQSFLVRFEDAYRAELAEFVRVAHGEAPSPCTGRDGLAALEVAVAATRALHEHRPVRVAEVR
jgi:myo-inositol 2-dehydrogenase/D-chiro-inositol 1-dehydrogenase